MELRQFQDASPGRRAYRLIKMAYWPKLLEKVLRQEKIKSTRAQTRAAGVAVAGRPCPVDC